MNNYVKRISATTPAWEQRCEPRTGGRRRVTLDDPKNKDPDGHAVYDSNRHGGRHVPFMGASVVQSSSQPLIKPEVVQKLRCMFPTVSETHIKALLLKYHGREAVVVSALQVEKYPVATPGPYTPPPSRPATAVGVRAPSPLVCRPQPKPHSPKMKLRYLKSVFPIVEETVLLDTLVSSDNNVTYATERLINLGFNKRDTPPPRVSLKKKEADAQHKSVSFSPKPPARIKTTEEKQIIKERLCRKHADVAERVVSLALDSADYSEETAETILSLMLEEKPKSTKNAEEVTESAKVIKEEAEVKTEAAPVHTSVKPEVKTVKKRQKCVSENRQVFIKEKHIGDVQDSATKPNHFISPLTAKPNGPNSKLLRGPNERLLLEDYVPWIGPQRALVGGSNKSLVSGSSGAKGPNSSLRTGPKSSLAKGSIYSNYRAMVEAGGN